jgi:hypothetical protein
MRLIEKLSLPLHFQHRGASIDRIFRFRVLMDTCLNILHRIGMFLFHLIQRYLYSLDSLPVLGLFNGGVVALISHKVMIILLHRPVSTWRLMLVWPCLFEFDVITLALLHRGLSSRKKGYKWGSVAVVILIMFLSSVFASLYFEANVQLYWERSIQVISIQNPAYEKVVSDWKFLGRFMAEGNGSFGKVFIVYALIGGVAVLCRLVLEQFQRRPSFVSRDNSELDQTEGQLRALIALPHVRVLLLLLFITLLLPSHPWRHMTATLGYDIVVAAFTVMKSNALPRQEATVRSGGPITQTFGNRNYNPTEDPYYITNLHQPMYEFIVRALEEAEFTNIVHITLESMREDSFPFQEDGLLNQYIHQNLKLLEPVNTQAITPFMASLAEHTLSWHTLWTTVPFTHKAMLGCTSLLNLQTDG